MFIRVKEVINIVDDNFQKSMSLHLLDEKNQEKLQKVENSAFSYFMNVKAQNIQNNSNLG